MGTPVRAAPARGRFLSIEGVDGAGKTTLLDALTRALQQRQVDCVRTREPGGTPLGEAVRVLMLECDMQALTETLLVFAARVEHLAQVIEPALQAGRWVLSDRYVDASYAYQGGGRGVARARLDTLAQWLPAALRPDLTILVDVAPELAQQRRAQARTADRFEREAGAFFARVRAGYQECVAREPERFLVLDGTLAPAALTAAILVRLTPWLT